MSICPICNTPYNPEQDSNCITCAFDLSSYPLSLEIHQDYMKLEQIRLQWAKKLWRKSQEKDKVIERDLQQRIEFINNDNIKLKQYITELEIQLQQLNQEKEDQRKQIAELLKVQTKLNEEIVIVKLQAVQDVEQIQQELDNKQAENLELQGETTTRQETIKAEMEQQITPSVSTLSRFTKLENLLEAQNFREADKETDRVMLAIANRQSEGWLRIEDAEKFPCQELRTIDNLWLKYSQGKFGISVQQKIYKNLGGTKQFDLNVWRSFGDRVAWRQSGSWLSYGELNFSMSTSTGHLPAMGVGMGVVWGWELDSTVTSFLSRYAECNP